MNPQQNNPDIAAYLYQRAGEKGIPLGGNFELTPRCNMNCKMCYIRMSEQEMAHIGRERTVDEWLDIAKQAKDAGMLFLLLTGGEPLLYDGFWELYTELKKMGLLISINTNAVLMTDEVISKFIELPPYKINVTVYGGSDETYSRLCRCPGGFARAVGAVKKLKSAGIYVKINGSITPENVDDIDDCFNIAKEVGAPCSLGCYMFPPVRRSGQESNRFSPTQAGRYQAFIDKFRYSQKDFDDTIKKIESADRGECPENIPFAFRCRAGRSSFWITWNGKMNACGMMDTFSLDPFKDGFLSCWEKINSSICEAVALSGCKGCPNREICKVCPAIAYAETGDVNGRPGYICKMLESWKEQMKLLSSSEE